MYRVKILSKAERQLKKLTKKNKPLARAFKKCINEISENPIREAKVGDIQDVWGHGFNFNKVVYRVAYIIDEEQLYIFIIGVGTHEGFWQEIKKYWNNHLKKEIKDQD